MAVSLVPPGKTAEDEDDDEGRGRLGHDAKQCVKPAKGRQTLQGASRKGKFRSFLLASIKNYLSKEADRARCLKRDGKVEFVPLDTQNAEEFCQFEPADFLTAETIFDARWATALLRETMAP